MPNDDSNQPTKRFSPKLDMTQSRDMGSKSSCSIFRTEGTTTPSIWVDLQESLEGALRRSVGGSLRTLSPFRYPGGKSWLIPIVKKWLREFTNETLARAEFIEPFAGGGSISLHVAHHRLVRHVTMIELDERVAAVWQTVLNGDWEWLCSRILQFELTRENVADELSTTPHSIRQQAFHTILLNRVSRGGIMAEGAGQLNRGESDRGIGSRWYPETLVARIAIINAMHDRISFIKADGLEYLNKMSRQHDALFFIDPPYSAPGKRAGARLYNHFEIDHEVVFRSASQMGDRFLMTYDDSEYIRTLASRYGFEVGAVPMRTAHHERTTELLIANSLEWLPTRFVTGQLP